MAIEEYTIQGKKVTLSSLTLHFIHTSLRDFDFRKAYEKLKLMQ